MLSWVLACSAPQLTSARPGETAVDWTDHHGVVVIGTGPAGAAAALTARADGADVLLLDRNDTPGLGLMLAGMGFAAGTRWQAERGITDSVELAAIDWPEITGARAEDGGVMDFLVHSAENLEWLESYGMLVSKVAEARDAGSVARVHATGWGQGEHDLHPLIEAFDGELRTNIEVTAPVMDGGRVIGVRWTDLSTGAEGATRADAVVIATGGFMRNLDEIARVAPGLAARDPVFESNPQSDGGGLPFLRVVGAGALAPGNLGVNVHSIQDPWLPDGESLLGVGVEAGIVVGVSGERFANEELQRSFDLFNVLPVGDVFEIFTTKVADRIQFVRPAYTWSTTYQPETFSFSEVAAASAEIFAADSPAAMAALAGIDETGMLETVEAWNATIAMSTADPYGRPMTGAEPLGGEQWFAVRLSPGLAKNFGGVATDVDGHVLDERGRPIPGLYAAGEVAGMVLAGGGGAGFAGSMNACYWGGRVAGASAAGSR